MNQPSVTPIRPRSSRRRYHAFVQDYKNQRLDDPNESGEEKKPFDLSTKGSEDSVQTNSPRKSPGKRREYLREYLRWLKPHRYAVGGLLFIALLGAGLQMVEPLFIYRY